MVSDSVTFAVDPNIYTSLNVLEMFPKLSQGCKNVLRHFEQKWIHIFMHNVVGLIHGCVSMSMFMKCTLLCGFHKTILGKRSKYWAIISNLVEIKTYRHMTPICHLNTFQKSNTLQQNSYYTLNFIYNDDFHENQSLRMGIKALNTHFHVTEFRNFLSCLDSTPSKVI